MPTPLEEIEAAIETLSTQRDAAMAGPWKPFAQHGYLHPAYGIEGPLDEQYGSEPGYMLEQADAELIVTLHRTIDAQLAVLEDGRRQAAFFGDAVMQKAPLASYTIALTFARAINGGA